MQPHNWNDLKYLLALYRTRRLKAAGRMLGVSETTVARRVGALEHDMNAALFVRSAAGQYEPTDVALQLLPQVEAIELGHQRLAETSRAAAQTVTGTVRISSVPLIVNRILVPRVAHLTRTHPHMHVELVPGSGNVDLSKREADLALRFARPRDGGFRIKAQKLGDMAFAPYAEHAVSPDQATRLGWITYEDAHATLPQARWLDAVAARSSERQARLKVADAETALEAVACGIGKSLLPCCVADADTRLRRLPWSDGQPLPQREIWLLAHVDQTSRSSILAVRDWLTALDWA